MLSEATFCVNSTFFVLDLLNLYSFTYTGNILPTPAVAKWFPLSGYSLRDGGEQLSVDAWFCINLHFYFADSIKTLPTLAFENLNSLETLNLQNNKLMHIPEEIMEPVVDTLRVIDIMGQ